MSDAAPTTGEVTIGMWKDPSIQLTATVEVPSSNCIADLDGSGVLDFFDISTFINGYNAQDPIADIDGNGAFDFFDVSMFLNAYNAGCP